MNILITGGAGYIGSRAAMRLAAAGFTPVVFDNLSKGRRGRVRWGPFEEGDVRDAARLAEVFSRHQPAAALHFAAAIEVGESVEDPGKYWDNNVAGTLSLVDAMVRHGCFKLVYSSTCAVYAAADDGAVDETSPLDPISPYAVTKRASEMMLDDFDAAHGLKSVIFRYFNVADADAAHGLGQATKGATHLMPRLLCALAEGEVEMVIHGDDSPTPDGTCIRDFIHVLDLVDAHILGLRRLLNGGESRVYNLGTGRGASVKQVIETASEVVGHRPKVRIGPRRAGDAVRLVSGSSRATDELDWSPQASDLKKILADSWAWMQAEQSELSSKSVMVP